MSIITPRITAVMLPQYTERYVRLIGKVLEIDNDHIQVEASGPVTVYLAAPDEPLELGQVYEFVAKVIADDTVKAMSCAPMGTSDYDADLIERVVKAEQQYPEMFAEVANGGSY